MNAPIQLAASWVALEDVTPGSHRWEGFLFSGRFKHYDEERDGVEQLQQWYRWLDEEAHRRGCEKVSFLPSKGDVLIWHGGLAHGGAPVTREGSSRLSLVGHYLLPALGAAALPLLQTGAAAMLSLRRLQFLQFLLSIVFKAFISCAQGCLPKADPASWRWTRSCAGTAH